MKLFFFFKVWDYNRFYQPKKQRLCDHPQWKGFLEGLQRVEAMCMWKKGGHGEARELPLASLSHGLSHHNCNVKFPSRRLKIRTEVSLFMCNSKSLVSVPIFSHVVHIYTIQQKGWVKQSQCKGYLRSWNMEKK